MKNYKITFNDWLSAKESMNIHCSTLDQLKQVCRLLNRSGKTWCDNEPYDAKNTELTWCVYEAETILDNKGCYGTLTDAMQYNERVYEFDEVDFGIKVSISSWFD